MTETMEDRACELGNYIVEHKATVRAAAQKFGLSKSSVHKDVTSRLYWADRALYEQVRAVLEENKREPEISEKPGPPPGRNTARTAKNRGPAAPRAVRG